MKFSKKNQELIKINKYSVSKKIIFILTLLVVLPLAAQKEATLHFKDGTVLKGLAKVKRNRIKFRKKKRAKKIFYTSKELETIEIKQEKNNEIIVNTYCYKKKKNGKILLLKQIEKGNVTLFLNFKQGSHAGISVAGGGMTMGNSYSISDYYVAKENEKTVTHLGTKSSGTITFSKSFKKSASAYFKDCPELVAKIESREYKKKHIVKIVKFYNENCD